MATSNLDSLLDAYFASIPESMKNGGGGSPATNTAANIVDTAKYTYTGATPATVDPTGQLGTNKTQNTASSPAKVQQAASAWNGSVPAAVKDPTGQLGVNKPNNNANASPQLVQQIANAWNDSIPAALKDPTGQLGINKPNNFNASPEKVQQLVNVWKDSIPASVADPTGQLGINKPNSTSSPAKVQQIANAWRDSIPDAVADPTGQIARGDAGLTHSQLAEITNRNSANANAGQIASPSKTTSVTPAATPTATAVTSTPSTPAATPASTVATPASTAAPASTVATAQTPVANTTNTSNAVNTTTNTANTSTPATYTPTGIYDPANLKAYNDQRVADIRALYEQALQNNLAGLRTAYDQNMSDAAAARDLISPQYQRSMNAMSAEYERQRRNNNMQAAANGLNTGAGSQMALAQSANYQANQAGLAAKENEALNEANRRIGDLQRNYQNAIAEATANNNYKLAAAMMEEYQNAYKRQMDIENTNYQRAQQLDQQNYTRSWNEDERNYTRDREEATRKAQYGDFSGYANLYGDDIAKLMETTWAMQNPQVAWASGKITAEDYYALTGKMPSNPNNLAEFNNSGYYTGLNSSGTGTETDATGTGTHDYSLLGDDLSPYLWSAPGLTSIPDSNLKRRLNRSSLRSNISGRTSSSKRGYSSSLDKGYRGAPGYLNSDGQFVVPTYGWNTDNTTAASGHEGDKEYAEAYRDALNYYNGNRTAATLGAQAYVTDVGTVKKS